MSSDGMVSMLAGQLLEAKARVRSARGQGKEVRWIEAIGRSLRRTLGCLVQLGDARELAIRGFALVVHSTGEIRVRHRERDLPISSSVLRALLEEAGVEPSPGQLVLLDDEFVVALVEEALGAWSQEEAERRDAKSRLIAASLEVGSPGTSGSPVARCRLRKAAQEPVC
jgi:hypothetical protein